MILRALSIPLSLAGIVVLASLFFGDKAIEGALLGVVAGGFAATSLFLTVYLLDGAKSNRPLGIFITILAFLGKFPAVGIAGFLAVRIGTYALIFFCLGVILVYSGLVWTAAAGRLFPTKTP